MGKPGFIGADMVKPGAVLVDVGINHIDTEADFAKFCPRSRYEGFKKKGSAITGDIHFQAYAKAAPLHARARRGGAADRDHADAQYRRAMQTVDRSHE